MKRLASAACVLGLFALLELLTTPVGAQGIPALKDIMSRLNKGPTSLTPTLKKELQDPSPPWADIQKQTQEYAILASALTKHNPPTGPADSWAKMTRAYADNAKAMDEAAKKRDKDGALAAHNQLAAACASCHKAHRQ